MKTFQSIGDLRFGSDAITADPALGNLTWDVQWVVDVAIIMH
jgi:hypothetical protein